MKFKAGDLIEHEMSFQPLVPTDSLPEGYITGIASSPALDKSGHRVLPGAFDVSIKKKGFSGPAGVKLLAHHDSEKNLGVIRKLETVDNNLRIEAELALKSSYVRDLYEVTKLNGGLSFSVGFRLEDYEFVEENKEEVFLIKQGELMEVSVVNFPACPDARMDFIKRVDTPSEFEKALMASDLAVTRNEAHKLMQLCKKNIHLFEVPVLVPRQSTHPLLDAHQLMAASDLVAKAKAVLSLKAGAAIERLKS